MQKTGEAMEKLVFSTVSFSSYDCSYPVWHRIDQFFQELRRNICPFFPQLKFQFSGIPWKHLPFTNASVYLIPKEFNWVQIGALWHPFQYIYATCFEEILNEVRRMDWCHIVLEEHIGNFWEEWKQFMFKDCSVLHGIHVVSTLDQWASTTDCEVTPKHYGAAAVLDCWKNTIRMESFITTPPCKLSSIGMEERKTGLIAPYHFLSISRSPGKSGIAPTKTPNANGF